MKMLVTGPKDTERVLDWVRDYNIVPLDILGTSEMFHIYFSTI